MDQNRPPLALAVTSFSEDAAAKIAGWARSLEEARDWAGRATIFPVTATHVRAWHDDEDVHPFVARGEEGLLAYGELWIDRAEREVELARIIVRPDRRGRGVGCRFVSALVGRAAAHEPEQILIRVAPHHAPAIRCYEGAGFRAVDRAEREAWNRDQPVAYLWLRYGKTSGRPTSL